MSLKVGLGRAWKFRSSENSVGVCIHLPSGFHWILMRKIRGRAGRRYVLDLFIIWSKSLKQLGTEPRQSLIDYRGSREAKVICCWRRIRHKTYFFLREEKEASCGSHHKSTNEEEQDSGENLCGSGMQVLLKAESGTETQRKVFGQQKCNTKHKLAAAWCWGNLKFVMLRRKL